ncbi:MAG: aminodeoxychorismate synthase component I [Peptococcaceae bacterium]|nr:aminodeoxychorismate synthase component I [Peptococcaceae bacterium]
MADGLPLVRELTIGSGAASLFECLRGRPYPFLLESSLLVEGLGRWSIMGADPFLVLRSRDDRVTIESGGKSHTFEGDPLRELRRLLALYRLEPGFLPFTGGAAGYFGYDLGRRLERLPALAVDDLHLDDLCLGFYDRAVVVDGAGGAAWAVSNGFPETDPEARLDRARERLAGLEEVLAGGEEGESRPYGGPGADRPRSHFDRDGYCRAVQKVREYIAAGEIFQANISQRFSCLRTMDPWTVYRRLARISPAPMAAFLGFPDVQVAGSTMERFLKVNGSRVETRPIKGTRPRGRDAAGDGRLARELWQSSKDRAELVMIVDMERNDLGRVCRTGSVQVPELFRLEAYATVYHLVATVTGELAAGKDLVDLLAASFPGGSISGAPKIRAMEIIEEVEPVRRGIYTGSIGYLGFDGAADLNIVIRSLVFKDGWVHWQVGGGITYDSDPYLEYLETLDKARALFGALGLPEGESRLWTSSRA